jgi:hypothetical protein
MTIQSETTTDAIAAIFDEMRFFSFSDKLIRFFLRQRWQNIGTIISLITR